MTEAKFIEEVTNCLKANDLSTAVNVFSDENNKKHLKNNCWDLIPTLCKHVTKEKKRENEAMANCCEELILKLASEANPEEGILEFLYQLDEEDSEKFRVVLDCIKLLLSRDTNQKLKSLEWTLNSIRSCMEQFLMEDESGGLAMGEESEVKDVLKTNDVADIIQFMNSIISFYEYVINREKINGNNSDLSCSVCDSPDKDKKKELIVLLSSRLLQMFDLIFPYVDLGSQSELQSIQVKMQTLMLKLIPNPMSLLEYVFYRAVNVMKPKIKHLDKELPKTIEEINRLSEEDICELSNEEININPFEETITVSDLAYGMFFYSILSQTENEQIKIPMVYNPKYVMLSLIHVTIPFFEGKKTNTAIQNGLNFLNLLLDRLNESLEKADLYFASHKSILIHLNNIMIYSQNEYNRKLSLTCFKKYINAFNWEARYYLLLKFRSHVTHPGTLGYLVVLVKEFVSKFLDVPHSSDTYRKYNKYYRGKLLFDIIKQYCFLTNGPKTDLVENADHVISSLNALLYLVLRDKRNVTDIKRFIKKIQTDFLNPLADNVKSSRSYYKIKLKEIEGGGNVPNSGSDVEFELSVKNETLPKLTTEQQKTAYQSCLNAIDLVDLLLKRLIEWFLRLYGARPLNTSSRKYERKEDSTKEDEQYDSKIREKILNASLQFVPTHGWSKEAIAHGAESLGYPGVTHGVFSNGGVDLINYFYVQCNKKLTDHMLEVTNKSDNTVEPKEFIKNSIEVRLRMLIPYVNKWPQAIAIMSMPPNVPIALANLLALSDDICYFAGDKSVDFNWYIRRVGVSGVYKVTELYMMQDKSTDFKQTWDFLERRLTEAVQIQQVMSNGSEATMIAKDVASAVFTTARNILHLNDPR